jgi:hypothetical protein
LTSNSQFPTILPCSRTELNRSLKSIPEKSNQSSAWGEYAAGPCACPEYFSLHPTLFYTNRR